MVTWGIQGSCINFCILSGMSSHSDAGSPCAMQTCSLRRSEEAGSVCIRGALRSWHVSDAHANHERTKSTRLGDTYPKFQLGNAFTSDFTSSHLHQFLVRARKRLPGISVLKCGQHIDRTTHLLYAHGITTSAWTTSSEHDYLHILALTQPVETDLHWQCRLVSAVGNTRECDTRVVPHDWLVTQLECEVRDECR